MKAGNEMIELLMHHRVISQLIAELIQLQFVGQLSIKKQECDLDKSASFGQLLNGITPVAENPLATIDEGDFAGTGRGRGEPGIVSKIPECRRQGFDIQCRLALGSSDNR